MTSDETVAAIVKWLDADIKKGKPFVEKAAEKRCYIEAAIQQAVVTAAEEIAAAIARGDWRKEAADGSNE